VCYFSLLSLRYDRLRLFIRSLKGFRFFSVQKNWLSGRPYNPGDGCLIKSGSSWN
jgi:hypothetical protein